MNDQLNSLAPTKRMFVMEYIKDFVASKAAVRCELAPATGRSYLAESDVQAAIAEQMEGRNMRTEIDADWVLQQLGLMFNADMADIFIPATNDLKPIHEWPEIWRKMATSIKVDDRDGMYRVKDVKILDRLKSLEMIGKHTDVRAFMDKVIIATDQELTDKLMAGRKRARNRNATVTVTFDADDFT